jgi:spermidine synthase
MTGLIIGSIIGHRAIQLFSNTFKKHLILFCSMAMTLFCLCIMAHLKMFPSLPTFLQSKTLFYLFIIDSGILGGIQFIAINTHYLNSNASNKNVGNIYGSDMVGSAIGALITSLFLIPIYGISKTLIILIILNGCASAFLMLRRSR